MTRWLIACFLLYFASTVHCQERKSVTTLRVAVSGAVVTFMAKDVIQTSGCLSHATCTERNVVLRPISTHTFVMAALKTTTASAVIATAWHIRHTQPKLSWGLLLVTLGTQALVTDLNARQLRRH